MYCVQCSLHFTLHYTLNLIKLAGLACLITEPDFPYCFWYILPEYYDVQYIVHSNVNCTVKPTLPCSVRCTINCTRHFTLLRLQRGCPILESVSTLPHLHCTVHSTVLPVLFTKMYTKLYTMMCTVICIELYTVIFKLQEHL